MSGYRNKKDLKRQSQGQQTAGKSWSGAWHSERKKTPWYNWLSGMTEAWRRLWPTWQGPWSKRWRGQKSHQQSSK